MRLYVNTRDVKLLKDALENTIATVKSGSDKRALTELLNRVELCEALQKNEKRARQEEATPLLNVMFGDIEGKLEKLCTFKREG